MAPFELGIVVEVFALPRPELEVAWWYELDVVAERPGEPLRMLGGMTMQVDHGLDRLLGCDTVVIPAWPVDREPSPAMLAALRNASRRGARIVSICSGAFLLAATGLLDGRTAATHWRYAGELQRRHPRIDVDPRVLYVEDPPFVTSAGSAAGIDACLHVIRSDHGSGVANVLARRMVVPAHRDGGQAQFIERPVGSADGDALLRQAMDWAVAHLAEPIRVDDLARRAFMSPRTFTRRFAEATGTSPLRWLTEQRVVASLPLLEASDHPVEHVGALVGFARPAAFRQQFQRVMRTTPSAYRRAFRARAAG
jgi:AraC family transcriptional activator FtrA